MIQRLICFLVVIMVCSCTEKELASSIQKEIPQIRIEEDSLKLNPNKGLVYYRNKPFTGISFSAYANNQTSRQITYIHGKKDGLQTMWFEDGTKSFKCNYVDGKQEGKAFTWWRNGQKRSESNYKKGIANGEQLQWYKSGAIFKKKNIVNGREDGLQQSWRENGKLYNNYEAKNGRIFGLKRATLCYELDDEKVQYKD